MMNTDVVSEARLAAYREQTDEALVYIAQRQEVARKRAEREASEPHDRWYYEKHHTWGLVNAEVRTPDEAALKLDVILERRAQMLGSFRRLRSEEQYVIHRQRFTRSMATQLAGLRKERRRLERLVLQPRLL